jgi:hypothetical protein
MMTVAPGIAAPDGSVMAPLIDPPTTCACDGKVASTSAAKMPAMAGAVVKRMR